MTPFEYHRPTDIAEATSLAARLKPLGGGTSLTVDRASLDGVIDLQGLSLDGLEITAGGMVAGASISLEALAGACQAEMPAVAGAARREAALNIRNMATLAGTIVASDGRSPLVTVLLAAGAQLTMAPDRESLSLDSFLDDRERKLAKRLIVEVRIPRPAYLGYLQVGRSPADLPIVGVAFARDAGTSKLSAALGGFGDRPILLEGLPPSAESAALAAREAYSGAQDAWASADYRAEVAGVLLRRLLEGAEAR